MTKKVTEQKTKTNTRSTKRRVRADSGIDAESRVSAAPRVRKHRIGRVVTKTGDGGDTGLADGSRVRKTDLRIVALGSLDELNAHLGLLVAQLPTDDALATPLVILQQRLFDVGAGLAVPGSQRPLDAFVGALEKQITQLNKRLPPLTEFILPGGGVAASQAHVARAVCRRAERDLLAFADAQPQQAHGSWLRFLNRTSDLLFVVARTLARQHGQEVLWRPAPPV